MALRVFRFGERQGLMLILGASLVAYVAVFIVYRVTAKNREIEAEIRPRVRWMPPPAGTETPLEYRMADLLDPSLMSLPSIHGFSRLAWGRELSAMYRVEDWETGPAFLQPSMPVTDRTLLEREPPSVFMQRTARKYSAQTEEILAALMPVMQAANRTVTRVEAGLANRRLLRSPPLPAITGETALRATWVRVGVTSEGEVRFAFVERSCGGPEVDARAQELARQFRFEPQLDVDYWTVHWGIVRFLWAVERPDAAALPGSGTGG